MTYRPGSIMMPMPSHRPLMEYGLYSVSVYALQLTLSSCCIVGPLHSKDINMVVQIEFSTVAKCMQRSAVNVEEEEDGEKERVFHTENAEAVHFSRCTQRDQKTATAIEGPVEPMTMEIIGIQITTY